MIQFQIRMYSRSFLWFAPTLTLLLWQFFVFASGGSTGSIGPLFPAYVIWGIWSTVSLGNMNDTPIRDMLAAALGSTKKHHLFIVFTIGVLAPLATLPLTFYLLLSAGSGRVEGAIVGSLVSLCGVALGAACGTWLHRPIIWRRNVTIAVGLVAVVIIVIAPPIVATLRKVGDGELWPAIVLAAASAVILTASTLAASQVSNSRAATIA